MSQQCIILAISDQNLMQLMTKQLKIAHGER